MTKSFFEKAFDVLEGALNFLLNQVLRLFKLRDCHAPEKGRKRSHLVGFSCLLLLVLPVGYLHFFVKSATLFDYFVYIGIGITSSSGDYIFCGSKRYPHLAYHMVFFDNWMAFITVVYNLSKFYVYRQEVDMYTGLDFFFYCLVCPLLLLSRRVEAQRSWVWVHTLWHFLATVVLLAILDMQRFVKG
ncbi:MAG: hypothetical protein AAF335_03115 [Bacteroidota bacterium]